MMNPELFHFLRPQWFLALLPLALLIWFMFFRKGVRGNWEAVIDERLLPYMLIRGGGRTWRAAIILIVAGGLLGIVALAGPTWDKLQQPVFTAQDALVIALDLSRSMDASDVSPSRLERARYKISDILNQRREGQTGLLVYAGEAFTVTPLTDDGETIRSQLSALQTDIMPVSGSRTDKAITLALDLLRQAGMKRGDVLLITDDAEPQRAKDSVAQLHSAGYRLSILGVGTRHGAPVLLPDGGFLQGGDGEIVIPTLDERALRALVSNGGGMYVRLSKDDQDTTLLSEFFSAAQSERAQAGAGLRADVWREQGPWLVLCLLPLALLLFRRGYILMLLLLPVADPSQALDWDDLWSRKDQQGQRAMDDGDYTAAAELFDDPAWRAAAAHRAEDYQAAIEALEQLDDVQSNYNRGNALARLGRYHEAIAAYDRTLAQQPDHADATFNRELLQRALEQQQEQQQPSQQGQQSEQERQQDQAQSPAQQQQSQGGEQQQQQSGQQSQEQQSGQSQQPQEQSGQQQAQAQPDEAGQRQQQEPSVTPEAEQEDPTQDGQQPRGDPRQTLAQNTAPETSEEQQATEQWLRRIPDDPAGLLRRKFRYQYQQRNYERNQDERTW